MEIKDDNGITVGFLTLDEALTGQWPAVAPHVRTLRDVDVLRVIEPPLGAWPALRAAGFVPKPTKISWIAPNGADDGEFLSVLSQNERRIIRRAQRAAGEAGIRVTVQDPVTPDSLEAFLAIYRTQVSGMRHGVLYADGRSAEILSEPYFAVWAHVGSQLVGGCLVVAASGARFTKMRFSAVAERFRGTSLSRTLYMEVVRASRERGFTTTSLGTEPNLYGHVAKVGLFRFKRRMGFEPHPSQDVGNAGGIEADHLLRLESLDSPSMILGYPEVSAWRGGWGHFYTSDPDLNLSPYLTDLMADVTVTRILEGRPVSHGRE
ncbi:GNAT family N-acetyltransferase [Streptomyces xiamenensis]|uniref:GNAT family N-acetyltransferase n=1 Tax=Streptomyces xiamenensis TaxID=408015 RepID=UPI0036E49FD4